MKKNAVLFLAASLLLGGCALNPNPSANTNEPDATQSVSESITEEESQAAQEEAAETLLVDSAIGMGVMNGGTSAGANGLYVHRASPVDNFKPVIADIFATQIQNFNIVVTMDTGEIKTEKSDDPAYPSLFVGTFKLSQEQELTAKLYYKVEADPDLTGGLKLNITGLVKVLSKEGQEVGIPNIPVSGYYLVKKVDGQMENSYEFKGVIDAMDYLEFSKGVDEETKEGNNVHVKAVVSGQTVLDQVIELDIPADGNVTVNVAYEKEGIKVDVKVSYKGNDVCRLEGNVTVTSMDLSVKMAADATIERDVNGKVVRVIVHFDGDPAETTYPVRV